MKLAVLDANVASMNGGHWMEAHRAGCGHLTRKARGGGRLGDGSFEIEAATLTAAAENIAGDFIDEGSMTVADALREIHFAPCVDLPTAAEWVAPDPEAQELSEQTVAEYLADLIEDARVEIAEEFDGPVHTASYRSAGVLTTNAGFELRIGTRVFQITVVGK